jgi:hypothetical protein
VEEALMYQVFSSWLLLLVLVLGLELHHDPSLPPLELLLLLLLDSKTVGILGTLPGMRGHTQASDLVTGNGSVKLLWGEMQEPMVSLPVSGVALSAGYTSKWRRSPLLLLLLLLEDRLRALSSTRFCPETPLSTWESPRRHRYVTRCIWKEKKQV